MNMPNKLMLASLALLAGLLAQTTQAEEATAQALTPAPVVEEKPVAAAVEPAPAPAQAMPPGTQPARDNHTDYRYCLDLKTNKEIIECRYKKK